MEIRGDMSFEAQSQSWRLLERERSQEDTDFEVAEGGSGMEVP